MSNEVHTELLRNILIMGTLKIKKEVHLSQ
jgi:hypothetical protein